MPSTYSDFTNALVDTGGTTPPLSAYVFVATSGTAALAGYFVNAQGLQEGAAFTGNITTQKTFKDISGSAVPQAAVGFIGALSGASVYMGLGGQPDGSVGSGLTPDSHYPVIAISSKVAFGRVSG